MPADNGMAGLAEALGMSQKDIDAFAASQSAMSGTGTGSAASTKGSRKVYTSIKPKVSPQQLRAEGMSAAKAGFTDPSDVGTKTKLGTKTVDQMYAQWNEWSLADKQGWAKQMVDMGLLGAEDAANYDTVKALWISMVDEAADYAAAGKKLTPLDVAKQYAAMAGPGGLNGAKGSSAAGPGGMGADFTGSLQTTNQFDITSPETARSTIEQIFQQNLGRAPGPGEIETFVSSLNAAERKNPIQATTDYENGQEVRVTKTGGLDRTGQLQTQARATPEYGAYQASTTYFDALLSAISSPIK